MSLAISYRANLQHSIDAAAAAVSQSFCHCWTSNSLERRKLDGLEWFGVSGSTLQTLAMISVSCVPCHTYPIFITFPKHNIPIEPRGKGMPHWHRRMQSMHSQQCTPPPSSSQPNLPPSHEWRNSAFARKLKLAWLTDRANSQVQRDWRQWRHRLTLAANWCRLVIVLFLALQSQALMAVVHRALNGIVFIWLVSKRHLLE